MDMNPLSINFSAIVTTEFLVNLSYFLYSQEFLLTKLELNLIVLFYTLNKVLTKDIYYV